MINASLICLLLGMHIEAPSQGVVGWCREGLVYKKNEVISFFSPISFLVNVATSLGYNAYVSLQVFLDIAESVNLLMSSKGSVLRCDVTGKILMKCFLSGMLDLKLGLNDKIGLEKELQIKLRPTKSGKTIELDDVTFHKCVNLTRFNSKKTVSFVPPDSEFELMNWMQNGNMDRKVVEGFAVDWCSIPPDNQCGEYDHHQGALSHGMHFSVLSCFRNIIASIALLPIVFIHRHSLPNMTMGVFLQILALGVLEPSLDHNLMYVGSKQTPASFLSCMAGVRPALTFIAAWIFRLEIVRFNQRRSQAKLLGTIIMAGGAIIIGLYSGPTISSSFHSDICEQDSGIKEDYIEGSTYVFISVVSFILYIILSGKVVMKYPAPLALTAYVCLTRAIIDTGVALALEVRHKASWNIGALLYLLWLHMFRIYLIKSKGSVFVTAFSPLSMILGILFEFIILGESVHLGSVIGAIPIIGGLFALLWGKSGIEEAHVS
ncbi:WAT1-related protein At2g39510-like [Camellia sinensis]|uniref:WAT1-related protein At2g39510-like n=1 Tax=Camellia sinensis TaxID=4442 RepID=UPI001036299F|nr:WAT1-related protein At2g39510-like [Camellia sinensis]